MQSRAEYRRFQRELRREEQYERSGFRDLARYRPVVVNRSKYMPHIGKKQRVRGAVNRGLN